MFLTSFLDPNILCDWNIMYFLPIHTSHMEWCFFYICFEWNLEAMIEGVDRAYFLCLLSDLYDVPGLTDTILAGTSRSGVLWCYDP